MFTPNFHPWERDVDSAADFSMIGRQPMSIATIHFFMKLSLLFLLGVSGAWGEIVINEILYNAPDDLEVEFVEFYHSGNEEIDVSRWSVADREGTLYEFPDGSTIKPGEYVVLCREPVLFEEFYGIKPGGEMSHRLGNGGDEVILKDSKGKVLERVAYDDSVPWPVVADGLSASLERISPVAPSASPDSWAPSPSSARYQQLPGGTPGKVNTAFLMTIPPRITCAEPLPERVDFGAGVEVRVELGADSPPVKSVDLVYRLVTGAGAGQETTLSMGAEGNVYSATIPGQTVEGILRYRIIATGQDGASRSIPHMQALRPAFSTFVSSVVTPGFIPVAHFILPEHDMLSRNRGRYRRYDSEEERIAQGSAAVVLTDPETKETRLFDFVHITRRSQGYKVRLHKDRLWRDMSTVNVLRVFSPRHSLCESLAFEFHRRAGVPAPWADYFRLTIDGQRQPYHLAFEQPNKSFLRRFQLDDDGNLYKAIWQGNHRPSRRAYPNGVQKQHRLIGRHEKKTNIHENYDDLVTLVESLENGRALDPSEHIINYFAANSLLSHWDGFHNNYFLYHEVSKKLDRWWMFPWDQDKTWGYHDGIRGNAVFADLPLGAGSEDFLPPHVSGRAEDYAHAIGVRGAPWFRYGGEVSRAVLSHPDTRRLFLLRVRELATEVFTEEAFGPEIDRLGKRLLPELSPREQMTLRSTLQIFRDHLEKRRRFVLDQKEIRDLK